MNKEIEEMANICERNKNEWSSHKQGFCYAQAEALYNAGYRKTVWHKVADGDLPPKQELYTEAKQYWCHYADDSGYTMAYFNDETKTFYDECSDEYWSTYNITDIDYWAELPKYEEEE